MKTILKIILIFTALISISCDNLFNDLVVEIGEYNYYLAVGAGENLRIYSIDSDGTLNSVYNQSIGVGGSIHNIAVHPTGKYLYVPDSGNDIFYVYKVNNDGSLTNIDSISTGASTNPYGVKVDPTGKYVYVSYSNISSNKIEIFSIGVNGKLTSLGTVSTPANSGPQLIDFNPSGKNIYVVLNSGGGFTAFKVDNNGFLFSPVTINISTGPYGLIVHPNGKYIYVSERTSSNILKYNLFSDGTVDSGSKSTYSVGTNNSNAMSIHPNGSFMYIKEGFSSYVYAYKIIDNGSLIYINQTPDLIPSGSCRLIVHPSGKYIYLTDIGGGNRLYYNIILNSDGLFDQNYSYFNTGTGISSDPAIIRRRKML